MPAIGLARTAIIVCEDFQHEVGVNTVSLLPAVGHIADVVSASIDKDDKPALYTQVAGVAAVVVTDILQVGLELGDGRIGGILQLIVNSPAEGAAGSIGE